MEAVLIEAVSNTREPVLSCWNAPESATTFAVEIK